MYVFRIKEKSRGKLRRGVLLQQDNAPALTSRIALAAAGTDNSGFEIISHPWHATNLIWLRVITTYSQIEKYSSVDADLQATKS